MPARKLTFDQVQAIRSDLNTPAAELAERYGITVRYVDKCRREMRHARQEAAREVIAQHVAENVPDALADLTDLRRIAREKYEESGDARQGQLWLGAVKTTLEHVRPDDVELDRAIEAELAELQPRGSAAVPGTPASLPAVH